MASFDTEGHGTSERNEGCRVTGTFDIDKIPGNFIFAAIRDQHLIQNDKGQNERTDFVIHELWFGPARLSTHDIDNGLANALGGVSEVGDVPQTIYQMHITIIPTVFVDGKGRVDRVGYQYTATYNHVQADLAPGLYFRHQHSAMSVEYKPTHQTWSHFLTNLCAIVGGVITVVGFAAHGVEDLLAKMTAQKDVA